MQCILILTKNVLVDQQLQDSLQLLGYEVFCTSKLLKKIMLSQNDSHILNQYPIIILSGTLSNQEIQDLLSLMKKESHVFLRKLMQAPSVEEKKQLFRLELDSWFDDKISLDSLRELLAAHSKQQNEEQRRKQPQQTFEHPGDRLKLFEEQLSKKEQRLFHYLIEAETDVVSRTYLCQKLWGDLPNNSHLSQLSLMIQKLKIKLKANGVNEIQIETLWGRGYQVNHL